jgi:spore coat protein CotH
MALRHRIPVRIRHYWKLLVLCGAFLVTCAVVFSTVRVAPLVSSASDRSGDDVTQNINGTVDIFDATVAHDITLTFRDADYQRMLDDYWDGNEKEYVEADLVVDGTMISSVGIRLKGNSTLGSLTRNGQSRPGGIGGGRNRGGQNPQGGNQGGFPGGQPPAGLPGADGAAPVGNPRGGATRAGLKAEEPENLPWLIRIDEFVDGRRYQGHREFAVRVGGIGGMGGGATVVNEALSLSVLAAAGQTAQRYAYSSFTVNDRPTTARLIVEHPDEGFADTLGDSGVLYKSLASGQFTDQGDDPTDYTDDFDQITMKGSQDLQPVINLIRWATTSSDTDFDKQLADHVDVQAFARYLAAQNLLLNFDDMSGPGRNYYLWYDLKTKKFTVVGWDYNLTFAGNATQGPHDSGGMGGRFRGGQQPQDQQPQGFEPPAGMQPPGGQQPGGGPGGGFGGMGGNKLKERFLASAAFKPVYEEAYRELYDKIYANGTAAAAVDRLAGLLPTVDGYNEQSTTNEINQLRTTIKQRTEHLATDPVITGG